MTDWLRLSAEEWDAVRLSLWVASVAMLASLPFGIAIAWLLARREFWGKSLLNGLVHLPLVLPPVVTGYLLLLTFGTRGPIGSVLAEFGIVFSFRWTGAALASAVTALSAVADDMRRGGSEKRFGGRAPRPPRRAREAASEARPRPGTRKASAFNTQPASMPTTSTAMRIGHTGCFTLEVQKNSSS